MRTAKESKNTDAKCEWIELSHFTVFTFHRHNDGEDSKKWHSTFVRSHRTELVFFLWLKCYRSLPSTTSSNNSPSVLPIAYSAMKPTCPSIPLFFLLPFVVRADVVENERMASIFERSARFSNALCLPLRDGCNSRSRVYTCTNNELGDFDTCDAAGAIAPCVKTIEGDAVCTLGSVYSTGCSSSRQCGRG
jgi:hypothetical protein